MSNPLISIIVPIYNAESFLNQCVDSILSQGFRDFELWLIDDGSSDASISIIKQYAQQDDRIHTAFIKGQGPSVPRNYGMRRAKGDYILFIDSDDYLTKDALEIFAGKIKEFPEADFIRGNQRILINEEREAASIFAKPRSAFADRIISGEDFMVKVLDKDYAPIDALFRRDFLCRNNIEFHEDLIILEDGPFIIEICSRNPKCVYINEETYVYRLGNPTSVTNSKKSYPKCKSLIKGAYYNAQLMRLFDGIGYDHIMHRSVEHSVSAIFQAATWLNSKEANDIYSGLRELWPELPCVGRSRLHSAFIRVYNISPRIAYYLLRLSRIYFKNKR